MLLVCTLVIGKVTQSEAATLYRDSSGITNLSAEYIPGNTTTGFFRHNLIQGVPDNVFIGLSVLHGIFLNANDINEIADNAFEGVPTLRFLQLNRNKLAIIKKFMLRGLFNLEILKIRKNEIHLIEEKSFNDLRSLKELILSRNKLYTISSEIFHPVHHPTGLSKFEIEDNPLFCSPCLCWLLQLSWIAPTTPDLTRCDGPTHLTGHVWSSLMADDLNCLNFFNITCGIEGKGIYLWVREIEGVLNYM